MGKKVILGRRIPKKGSGASEFIIYRQITMNCYKDDETEEMYLDVIYANDCEDPIYDKTIDEFVCELLSGKVDFLDSRTPSPLDLNCDGECYIVFQLDPLINWQFSSHGESFLTKDDKGSKYFGLVHVMPDGKEIPSGEEIGDDCRIIYFRARGKKHSYQDGFNLLVDLRLRPVNGEVRRTKIIIDPDIRNPGGSGGGTRIKPQKSVKSSKKEAKKALRKASGENVAK